MLPNFDDLSSEEAYTMMTTFMELSRMIRDNDPNTDNERAAEMWAKINES